MSDDIVLQTITITKKLLADEGVESYSVDYTGDVGWLEGLGLLEAAKFDLHHRCFEGDDESE